VVRAGRLLLVALAVALVAEGAGRALDQHLAPVTGWPGNEYGLHEEQLAARGGEVELLVLGDSSGAVAIVPDELVDPGSGYNYWLGGAPMRSVELLASEVVLDRVAPTTVIVGLTMRNFNDAPGQASHLAALESASAFRRAAGRRSGLDHVDDWLQEHSALFRHRASLRDPLELVRTLRSPLIHDRLGPDGHIADRGADRLADEPDAHRQQEEEAMADYAVSPLELAALHDLLAELERRRITVLVVSLPVTGAFIDLAEDGTQDYARFISAVRSTAYTNGAHVLDAMEAHSWPDHLFGDVNHLNALGTARLRPILTGALVELHGARA
jgi:hypothetical protein